MKLRSYFAALGSVALSCAALGACTVNSTNTNDNDAAADNDSSTGSTEDSATTDTGTAADTGTVVDTGTTTVDAGDASATCAVALDTGSTDCDSCVATSCCTQLTTCVTPDDAGVDDAGNSACLQLLFCINDVNSAADASVDAGAGESTCDPSYSQGEQTATEAVLTCIRTSCSAQCPGL